MDAKESKTDIFLNEYKALEEIAVTHYGFQHDGRSGSRIEELPEFKKYRAELSYCREVRNLLQHKPKVGNAFAVEPSDQMIDLLRKTIEIIKNPPKAIDIAVLKANLIYKCMDDYVRPAMIEMQKNHFTHIPILQNDVVVGVFSENTLLSCLIDNAFTGISDKMKFVDIASYLPIDDNRSESFKFISRNARLEEANNLFDTAVHKQERIGLVFITQNGKPTEKLLGIISAWDVAAAK